MKLPQRTLVYLVAALMVAACVGTVEAQGRRGGQDGRGGFGQRGPGGRSGFQPGGGGFGMMGGNIDLMLLERADVRKELDLLDDQIKELQGLRDDLRRPFEGLRDLSREEQREKMPQMLEAAREKAQEIPAKVNEVLLPHQATRLKQLAVQFAMQSRGGINSGTVAEQLGISDQQREQLREKARKLQQELQNKLQAELLKELNPEQQAKLKQLTGKPFTFEQTAPQFGGGRGGPGARGGRRRGN